MDDINFSEMSNSELKLFITKTENEFEATKAKLSGLLIKLDEISNKYNKAKNELKIRKNIFL